MRLFVTSLPFFAVVKAASASDVEQPPETTAPAQYKYIKRADPTATITGGPASNWFPSAGANAPKPTGSAFTLVAGDPSVGGFDVYVGDDLRKSLDKVLEEKCSDVRNADCHNQLQALFKKDDIDKEKRQFGLIAGIAELVRPLITTGLLGGIAGVIIGGNRDKKTPPNWHAPEEQAAPLQASGTASALAIATASNDPNPLVIAVPGEDKPEDPPTVKGEANGDYTINVSQDLSTQLDVLLDKNIGNCPHPTKRDLNALEKRQGNQLSPELTACITAGMVLLIKNVYQGSIAQLARLRQQGQVVARPRDAGALVAIANAGREIAQYQRPMGLNDEEWRALTVGVYWEVYNREVARQSNSAVVRVSKELQDQTDQKFCPPKDLLRCASDSCKGKDGKCAEDAKYFPKCDCTDDNSCAKAENTPYCDNCGGDKGGLKCQGINGQLWKDCTCLRTDKGFRGLRSFDSKDQFDQTQKLFGSLPDLPDDPDTNHPHCELRKRVDGIVNVETKLFQSVVKNAVCKDFPFDITSSFDKTFTKDDASKSDGNWDNYKDFKFQFKWDDKPKTCIDTCETIFDSFTSSACSSDSHSMHAKGSMDLDCGTASFQITSPPPQGETCRKKTDEVTKDDDKRNSWKFVDQKTLDDNIHLMCHDQDKFAGQNNKGLQNAAGGELKKKFNEGDLNEVELLIKWDSGVTKTPDDCEKDFLQVSANCDSDTDIHNWKWGGSVNAGSITYSATPQKNRVPQKEPPADKSRYFRVWYEKPKDGNGKRNQGKRYGVNGKEYDLMQITECVHDLRRQSFAGEMLVKGASKEFDCAGYFTLLWWLGPNYGSTETCFGETWENMLWKVLDDGAISLESYHTGTATIRCGMQIKPFDNPKNDPQDKTPP